MDGGVVFQGDETHIVGLAGAPTVSLATRAELGVNHGELFAGYDPKTSSWEHWNLINGARLGWPSRNGSQRVLALDAPNDRCLVATRHALELRRAGDGHLLSRADVEPGPGVTAIFGPGRLVSVRYGGRLLLIEAASLRQVGELFALPDGSGVLFVAADGHLEATGDLKVWTRAVRCRRGAELPFEECSRSLMLPGLLARAVAAP